MKNVKFLAAGAALCALAMAGCTNETDEAGAQVGEQVLMTVHADAAPQTRADYTQDGTEATKMNFSWRAKDEISVQVFDGGNANCQLTTTEKGKSVNFSGKVNTFSGEKTIYAFYPYDTTPRVVSGGIDQKTAVTQFILPNPQLYTIGGPISNSLMVGVGTATASGTDIKATANLKQVMSIIKLNITNAPAKVTGVKLKCTSATFATVASVKLSDATITNPSSLVNELSMTVTDNSEDHTATKEISFAIFPKTKVNGKTIRIEVIYENGESKRIVKDDIAFERNMHYVVEFDGTPIITTWAKGNLVADGANGAKIGAPTDGGLYFQFGSLVGWAGGASGDGTGMPKSDNPGYLFNATGTVVPSGRSMPTSWNDPNKWTVATGNVPAEFDPCTKYLGSDLGWRLPTKDEYETLFENNGYPTKGPWKWVSPTATNSELNLTFPIPGYRLGSNGNLSSAANYGYYWSGSTSDAANAYLISFNYSGLSLNTPFSRTSALPVRCVHTDSK